MRVTMLVSANVEFKVKNYHNKEEHYILIKEKGQPIKIEQS